MLNQIVAKSSWWFKPMSTSENQSILEPVSTSRSKNKIVPKKAISSYFSQYASPLGGLLIRHNGKSIQQLQYAPFTTHENIEITPLPKPWLVLLHEYFAGNYDALNKLPVQLDTGTVFQQQVWLGIRAIKAGETTSYLKLAQKIERPRAIRAIGQALKRNPIPLILPCHRVIQQSGGLGGYEGDAQSSYGRKQFLLWHEGVFLSNKKQ